MKIEEAKKVQERIAKEAIALMVIQSEEDSKTDIGIDHYEKAIILVGKAWNIPMEDTARSLSLIRQEREVLNKLAAGEDASHVLPETELPMNATGAETLENVLALFETAIRLDRLMDRKLLYHLASELAVSQNLSDWVEQAPMEKAKEHEPGMEMAI